jgi:hypothetical protein
MAISKKWHARLIIGLASGVMLPCLICSCGLVYIAWWAWTQNLLPTELMGQASSFVALVSSW